MQEFNSDGFCRNTFVKRIVNSLFSIGCVKISTQHMHEAILIIGAIPTYDFDLMTEKDDTDTYCRYKIVIQIDISLKFRIDNFHYILKVFDMEDKDIREVKLFPRNVFLEISDLQEKIVLVPIKLTYMS